MATAPVIKKGSGIGTIVWGTDGVALNELNVLIVKRVSGTSRGGPTDIAGNKGTTEIVALIKDGRDVDITVVYDSGVAELPKQGDEVLLSIPPDSAGGVNYFVTEDGVSVERGSEMEYTFKASRYQDIPLSGTPVNNGA
jgi:hypothetical protein